MGPQGTLNMAERVGFEPTRGLRPLRAFQTRLFDHSSTSPLLRFYHNPGDVDALPHGPVLPTLRRRRFAAAHRSTTTAISAAVSPYSE